MRVLFDHQIYIRQSYGGISRYFYELSKGLNKLDVDVENTVLVSNNVYTEDSIYNAIKFLPNAKFKGKTLMLTYPNKLYSKKKILKDQFDVFHPTYYDPYFLSYLKKPFVVTFYDLIHEKFGSVFKNLEKDKSMIKGRQALLEKAAKVIAISQSTKNDIINYYKVDPKKIEVIHLANSIDSNSSTEYIYFKDYILFVGQRISYKNFIFFIEAIKPLLVKEKQLKVLCAGGGPFSFEELKLLSDLNLTTQVIQVEIDDQILSSLYKNALLFVLPSLYEGFGIPLLEAFNCSCPAVVSNTSSLPEVGGTAALYFNPNDKEDILDKVSLLLYNSTLKNQLVEAGRAREKTFSWKKTIEKHSQVYKLT